MRAGFIFLALAFMAQVLAQPAPNGNSVLLLAESVSSGFSSLEATRATALGFTVVIRSIAQWSAMTTAQFQSFQALVVGDPTCGVGSGYAPQLASIAGLWGPAVSAGNIIIVGTDPAFHFFSRPGAGVLTEKAINFAAAGTTTGAYISLSCGVPPSVLGFFGSFSTFEYHREDAHIVATDSALNGLTDAALANWGNSVHVAFSAFPSSFLPLAIIRDTAGSLFPDGSRGFPYILARGATLVAVTKSPTKSPTLRVTNSPTFEPTSSPTVRPSNAPTDAPSTAPTVTPTDSPTTSPSTAPTYAPSQGPTVRPSNEPTVRPSNEPTVRPSNEPTVKPSNAPTYAPSDAPTVKPSDAPTPAPTRRRICRKPSHNFPVVSVADCAPFLYRIKPECDRLIDLCLCQHGIALKWAHKACQIRGGGHPDAGCQCENYCGYECQDACEKEPGNRCRWVGSAADGYCENKVTGERGPITTC